MAPRRAAPVAGPLFEAPAPEEAEDAERNRWADALARCEALDIDAANGSRQ